MFNCGSCGETTEAKAKSHLVTVETRKKTYPRRQKANKNRSDDPGGEGYEIAREIRVGPCCANRETAEVKSNARQLSLAVRAGI